MLRIWLKHSETFVLLNYMMLQHMYAEGYIYIYRERERKSGSEEEIDR